MEVVEGQLRLSASDLIDFLECEHLTRLNLARANGQLRTEPKRPDTSQLIARKGEEHERAHLELLRSEGGRIVEITDGLPLEEAVAQTSEALKGGAWIVYQGALAADGWR